MGLITKEVEVNINNKNIGHYKALGYDCKIGKKCIVKAEDLSKHSTVNVIVKCDYCGQIKETKYVNYSSSIETENKYCCSNCIHLKQEEMTLKKYGVRSINQLPEVIEKRKKTCMEKYGVSSTALLPEVIEKRDATNIERYGTKYPMQNKGVQNKVIETNRKKYGVDYVGQREDVKEKRNNTMMERYGVKNALENPIFLKKAQETSRLHFGVDCPLQDPEVNAKRLETLRANHGVDVPAKNEEIRFKMAQTKYINGNCMSSKQQRYLHVLYGGTMNYPINSYSLDIAFQDEKMFIEYNGKGHDLNVVLKNMTREEFEQKEIIRNNVLKRNGWKQVCIISTTDKLPSDEILLQMLEISKQYFKDYPNHSWIEWRIDEGIYRNAEEPEGSFFDYGSLRRIKDTDLVTCDSETVA